MNGKIYSLKKIEYCRIVVLLQEIIRIKYRKLLGSHKWNYFKWVFKSCITLQNLNFVHIYCECPRLKFYMPHSHTHFNMKPFFVTRASLEPLFLEMSFAEGWQKPSGDRKYLLDKKASLPHCTNLWMYLLTECFLLTSEYVPLSLEQLPLCLTISAISRMPSLLFGLLILFGHTGRVYNSIYHLDLIFDY